jgi:bifunctional non-homologous end joining protein LigD
MTATLIRPMLATAAPLPTGAGWGFEFKWDGVRAIAYVEDGSVRLFSRNDRDISQSYPELQALGDLVDVPCVLDGEIVTLDQRGAPSFGHLQERMHVRHPDRALMRRVPVAYYVFDVLRVDEHSFLRTPYSERRACLEELAPDGSPSITVPPAFLDADGRDVVEAARELGLEGVVAKRLDSIYEPGRRSRSWIKVPFMQTQEVVVGGWKQGAGTREGTIGALLLGAYDDTGLRYIGDVGTGFSSAVLGDLLRRIRPLEQDDSPFVDPVPRDHARGARWLRPELVGEVEFRTWTREGRIRHSSWRGLRPDKSPQDVRLGGPA